MTSYLKRLHRGLSTFIDVRKRLFPIVRLLERLIFGGRTREAILLRLLGALYRSQYRREWRFYSHEAPHFFNHRLNGFEFVYGRDRSPFTFFRGFLALEVIRDGDHLLDIGCGDGFFSSAFFAAKCRQIDAIDVEPSAIAAAQRLNLNPRILFHLKDAVREPFPSPDYDVVVWDGAIGHFSPEDLSTVLEKIRQSISPAGIFVGSESLGTEGSDHLQFFKDEAALASIFRPFFKHVLVRVMEYRIRGGYIRKEAYWRCTNDSSSRHADTAWRSVPERSVSAGMV